MEVYDMQMLMGAIQQMKGQQQSSLGAISALLPRADNNTTGAQAVMQKGQGTIQSGAANMQQGAQTKQQKKAEAEQGGGFWTDALTTAGTIGGSMLGTPALGGAIGGALGNAGGQLIDGGQFDIGSTVMAGGQGALSGWTAGKLGAADAAKATPDASKGTGQLVTQSKDAGYYSHNYGGMDPSMGRAGAAPNVNSMAYEAPLDSALRVNSTPYANALIDRGKYAVQGYGATSTFLENPREEAEQYFRIGR